MRAGASQTDITPPLGTFINGDFFLHYATTIHDPLYAKALVLEQAPTVIAIVVVDICVMPKDFVDAVKNEITRQTGIPFQNILISSTHTHAAGSVESIYLAAADLLYKQKLSGLIVQAVKQAQENLHPAKTAFGSVDVPQHVRCRRYFMQPPYRAMNPVTGEIDRVKTNPFDGGHLMERPQSPVDPQVSFMAVQGREGDWISILANYSLHYVGDWDNGTITADYFGVFARQVQQKLQAGSEFVGIMSNGTSGDINIWEFNPSGLYPDQPFQKSAFIGNDIAEKVRAALFQLQWEEDPSLAAVYEEVPLKVRKPSPEELEKAKEIITNSQYESLAYDQKGLRSVYAREQVLLNELPDEMLFPLQAIRIGEGIIGGLGGEIFAETGLWLKTNSPAKKYFTIGLANANCGYIPPASAFKLGGYETWRSRTSKCAEDAEACVKNKQLALIHEAYGDNKERKERSNVFDFK